MSEVTLIAITQPLIGLVEFGRPLTAEEFVAYTARVSNPSNQMNTETAPKLLKYLAKHHHWSPFEMVSMTFEIRTTRDIGRQILRHRSFTFQEFSQRYAEVHGDMIQREARLQDHSNRQNSIEIDDAKIAMQWNRMQEAAYDTAKRNYKLALDMGIAKEQARALLPEGLTASTMYMTGSLRSFIHYCAIRCDKATQKEHREIADKVLNIVICQFPSLEGILDANI